MQQFFPKAEEPKPAIDLKRGETPRCYAQPQPRNDKPYYEIPLVGKYLVRLPDGTSFTITADELLDAFNRLERFPTSREELRNGFELTSGKFVFDIS